MPLVLAIEPDERQAAIVRRLVREYVRADVVCAGTKERAIETLRSATPDLVLLSVLLDPRDEAAIAEELRALDGTAYLETLTIPVLAPFGSTNGRRGKGLLASLGRRRRKDVSGPGCDPRLYAREIRTYLERVRAARAEAEAREQATRSLKEASFELEPGKKAAQDVLSSAGDEGSFSEPEALAAERAAAVPRDLEWPDERALAGGGALRPAEAFFEEIRPEPPLEMPSAEAEAGTPITPETRPAFDELVSAPLEAPAGAWQDLPLEGASPAQPEEVPVPAGDDTESEPGADDVDLAALVLDRLAAMDRSGPDTRARDRERQRENEHEAPPEITLESLPKTPPEAPFETPAEAPASALEQLPVDAEQTSFGGRRSVGAEEASPESVVEGLPEAPVQIELEAPQTEIEALQAAVDALPEAPPETPFETPAEAPASVLEQLPVDAEQTPFGGRRSVGAEEASPESVIEGLPEAPVQNELEAPQTEIQTLQEAPPETILESLPETAPETALEAREETSFEAPAQIELEALQTELEALPEAPPETALDALPEAPPETPFEMPAEAPASALEQFPVDAEQTPFGGRRSVGAEEASPESVVEGLPEGPEAALEASPEAAIEPSLEAPAKIELEAPQTELEALSEASPETALDTLPEAPPETPFETPAEAPASAMEQLPVDAEQTPFGGRRSVGAEEASPESAVEGGSPEAPVQNELEAPQTEIQTLQEAPPETILESLPETAPETALEAREETSFEAPAQIELEALQTELEALPEAPPETALDALAEAPPETPFETPAEAPASALEQFPVDAEQTSFGGRRSVGAEEASPETVSEGSLEASVQIEHEAPQTEIQTLQEAPPETILESLPETAPETALEAREETSFEASAQIELEAPHTELEALQAALEALPKATPETVIDALPETPRETSLESREGTSLEAAAKIELEAPQTELEALQAALDALPEAPPETPFETPAEAPASALEQLPVDAEQTPFEGLRSVGAEEATRPADTGNAQAAQGAQPAEEDIAFPDTGFAWLVEDLGDAAAGTQPEEAAQALPTAAAGGIQAPAPGREAPRDGQARKAERVWAQRFLGKVSALAEQVRNSVGRSGEFVSLSLNGNTEDHPLPPAEPGVDIGRGPDDQSERKVEASTAGAATGGFAPEEREDHAPVPPAAETTAPPIPEAPEPPLPGASLAAPADHADTPEGRHDAGRADEGEPAAEASPEAGREPVSEDVMTPARVDIDAVGDKPERIVEIPEPVPAGARLDDTTHDRGRAGEDQPAAEVSPGAGQEPPTEDPTPVWVDLEVVDEVPERTVEKPEPVPADVAWLNDAIEALLAEIQQAHRHRQRQEPAEWQEPPQAPAPPSGSSAAPATSPARPGAQTSPPEVAPPAAPYQETPAASAPARHAPATPAEAAPPPRAQAPQAPRPPQAASPAPGPSRHVAPGSAPPRQASPPARPERVQTAPGHAAKVQPPVTAPAGRRPKPPDGSPAATTASGDRRDTVSPRRVPRLAPLALWAWVEDEWALPPEEPPRDRKPAIDALLDQLRIQPAVARIGPRPGCSIGSVRVIAVREEAEAPEDKTVVILPRDLRRKARRSTSNGGSKRAARPPAPGGSRPPGSSLHPDPKTPSRRTKSAE